MPSNRPYVEMTDSELASELREWESLVESAAGWSSAYFAARQCEAIERTAQFRGFPLTTKHHVVRGGPSDAKE